MGVANSFVPLALVAFIPIAGGCFSALAPRRAVLLGVLGGWLFLPHFDGHYRFLVFNSKAAFVPAVVLVWSVLVDGGRLRQLRLRWFDLPMVIFCVGSFATALSNDLGLYEAASAILETTLSWAAPYLLGRLYFGHRRGMDELATALVIAGLVYVPFCLWEIRMSPQLHYLLYGFRSENFDTVIRFGGYRPSVFMVTGIALSMFMAVSTLSAFWLWRTRARTRVGGVPIVWTCVLLALTTVACKSTGAILLLAGGIALLESTRLLRTPVLILIVAAIPAGYCTARLSGWDANPLVTFSASISSQRAESVQFRIYNENLLIEKALKKPWLGWGRFGRSFVYSEEGERLTITDGMWIIVLGVGGFVGLVALSLILAFPPLLLLRACPTGWWNHAKMGAAAAMAVVLLLWAIDNLLNAMLTPLYPAISGGLVSFVILARTARSTMRSRPSPSSTQAA